MLTQIFNTLVEQRKLTTKDRSWWQGAVVGLDLENQLSKEPWPPQFSRDKPIPCETCGIPMCDHAADWLWFCHHCDKQLDRETIIIGHVGDVPLLLLKNFYGESAVVITVPLD